MRYHKVADPDLVSEYMYIETRGILVETRIMVYTYLYKLGDTL